MGMYIHQKNTQQDGTKYDIKFNTTHTKGDKRNEQDFNCNPHLRKHNARNLQINIRP